MASMKQYLEQSKNRDVAAESLFRQAVQQVLDQLDWIFDREDIDPETREQEIQRIVQKLDNLCYNN